MINDKVTSFEDLINGIGSRMHTRGLQTYPVSRAQVPNFAAPVNPPPANANEEVVNPQLSSSFLLLSLLLKLTRKYPANSPGIN